MLQNAYFLAKIGADTAENEQHFAEILPKTGNYPTGPRPLPGNDLLLAFPAGRRPRAYVGSPTQLSNYLTLKGSFSAVSKPNFASKYSLESSRRDLHNALLCTVLESIIEKWGKKDLAKTTPKIGENKKTRGQ